MRERLHWCSAPRYRPVPIRLLGLVMVWVSVCLPILWGPEQALAAARTITIRGSDTLLILNRELAAKYTKANPSLKFDVLGGGSGLGISALLSGETDIAAASRAMNESEKAAFERHAGTRPLEVVVALDGVGVYVHNNNPISRLTIEQLRGILGGQIRNWRDVGGPNRRIDVYNRDKNSGTRAFMQEYLLAGQPFTRLAYEVSSTSMLMAAVSRNQNAIGYGGIAYAQGAHIVRLADHIDGAGIWPDLEGVSSGKYPLSRPLYYYVNPAAMDDGLRGFLRWVVSARGQNVVTSVGYYPAPKTEGERLAALEAVPSVAPREPIRLTRDNMREHGFDLAITLDEPGTASRSGQSVLTLHLNLSEEAARKIRTLSLRIGEDADVPMYVRSALREALMGSTTLYLAETESPDEGASYAVPVGQLSRR